MRAAVEAEGLVTNSGRTGARAATAFEEGRLPPIAVPNKALPNAKEWEYVTVRKSGVHGRGLFAAVDIPKGTFFMEYRGERVPKKEGTRRTNEQWDSGRIYTFELNKKTDIDGSPEWNIARLANHSCDPNSESQNERGRKIWIVALRDIPKGAEISYDYNFPLVDPPPLCKCSSPKCRGFIVGSGHKADLRAWLKREGYPIPASIAVRRRKSAKTAKKAAKKSR